MGKLHERNINTLSGRGWASDTELKRAKEAKKQKKLDKIYSSAEMPDEQDIRRKARRKAATRRGSRISTVLTETLG